MKKLSLALILAMICGMLTAQTVEMSYSFSQPKVTTLLGYDKIKLEG